MTYPKVFFAAITTLLLSSCASLQQQITSQIKPPVVGYHSLTVGKITSTSIRLLPVFSVTNTNMFAIPVNDISYQLSLNNKQLVAGKSQAIGTLGANQSKNITLAMEVSNESLISMQQLLFKNGQVDYFISGSVNVVGIDIPFEKKSTIFMPKIKLSRINITKASFNEMELVAEILINNPNDFQLPLDNLNYSVSSGTTALFNGTLNQQQIEKGSQTLRLPLKFKPAMLFSNVFSLLRKPDLPLTFTIDSPLFSATHHKTLNLGSVF